MTSDSALPPVVGAIATDRDGNPLGTITSVFLDDATQRPTWVGLTEGMHADPADVPVIAPLADAELTDDQLRLTVSAVAVRTAPRVARADRLTPAEETTLRDHYRSADTTARAAVGTADDAAVGTPSGTAADAPAGTVAGIATDSAMTRSEEQLQVSTVVEPWTRAVLRIEEVTEEVMVPVTITRQQARIEYLPVIGSDVPGSAGDAAAPGTRRPTSTTDWVTLYTEQPVVTLNRTPTERVRLSTSWTTEETAVSEQLRRERIDLDTTETPLG